MRPTPPVFRQNEKPCACRSLMMPPIVVVVGKFVYRCPRMTPLTLAEDGEFLTSERMLAELR